MSPSRLLPSGAVLACRLVATLLLVGCSGCFKVATDESGYVSDYAPYAGAAPLTIRGVYPGQAGDDVVSLLGPPDRGNAAGFQRSSLQWQRFSDMVVTLDGARRVIEVLGDELTGGADAVVAHGMSEADVRQILGQPARSVVHYRPSGSGVISIGRKRTGTTLSYRRDERTIEITLLENGVAYIRLTQP